MKKNLFIFLLMIQASLTFAEDIQATMGWADLQKMGFAVNGLVESVHVKPGQKVNKGDVLAKLDALPFSYQVTYCKAAIEKIRPTLSDAKKEFDQAKELFERTVLSEVELSKIEGTYKSLKAEESMASAECQLMQWQAAHAFLKATGSAYIVSSNIFPGMVISDENKSLALIELVSATKASATSLISSKQAQQYKIGDSLKVVVDEQLFAATVEAISLHTNMTQQYELKVVFYYPQTVESGKAVTLRFE